MNKELLQKNPLFFCSKQKNPIFKSYCSTQKISNRKDVKYPHFPSLSDIPSHILTTCHVMKFLSNFLFSLVVELMPKLRILEDIQNTPNINIPEVWKQDKSAKVFFHPCLDCWNREVTVRNASIRRQPVDPKCRLQQISWREQ